MFICNECGHASEDGYGFCSKCGSTNGRHVDDTAADDKMRVETPYGSVFVDEKVAKRVPIAMMLAFIPGFFDIFGLGQLYMRSYLRSAVFLGLTGFVAAVRFGGVLPALLPYIPLVALGVFILQLFDMYRLVSKLLQ